MYFRWCCRAFLRSSCGDPVVQPDARQRRWWRGQCWKVGKVRFDLIICPRSSNSTQRTARWPSYRDQDEHRGATQKGFRHEYGKAHCWHPCVSPKALTGPLRPFGRLGLDLDVFSPFSFGYAINVSRLSHLSCQARCKLS